MREALRRASVSLDAAATLGEEVEVVERSATGWRWEGMEGGWAMALTSGAGTEDRHWREFMVMEGLLLRLGAGRKERRGGG